MTALPFPLAADEKEGSPESICCISSSLSMAEEWKTRPPGPDWTRLLSLTRRASLGVMRGEPYFNPTHRPSTETQKADQIFVLTLLSTTGFPHRRLHRSIRWIDRGVRSACLLSSYHTLANFLQVQDADLCQDVSIFWLRDPSRTNILPFVASLGKRSP